MARDRGGSLKRESASDLRFRLERTRGFEPATPTLARFLEPPKDVRRCSSLQVTGVPPRGGHTRTVTNRRGLTNIGREIGRDGHQARSATSSACQQDWAEAVTQDLANQDASWPSTNFCRFPPDNPKGEQTASADDNS